MKVLIAGSAGQLGRALQATAPKNIALLAPPEAEFNILNKHQVEDLVSKEAPGLLINAAAYTAVDRAESDRETAIAINATAAAHLAQIARQQGARFVHVSTDFVFDGKSSTPYKPDAHPAPLGVYGETKLMGEAEVMAGHPHALIVRTAWVYAAQGNNFVKTMLRLMRERDEVRVVADQIGTPTHATSLARAIWALAAAKTTGIHHWTDAGVASWYDFAVAIQEEALQLGLLERVVPIVPIRTTDYPTPAERPAMGLLDKDSSWAIAGVANHWRAELRLALAEMKDK